MKRRILLVLVVVFLLTGAVLLPDRRNNPRTVIHQHMTCPAEQKDLTGFQPDGSLTSHLPLILIDAGGRQIPGTERSDERELDCVYSVIDHPDGVNNSRDVPTQQGTALISIRGNSSRKLPKKQYSLKLIDAGGMARNEALLGLPAESIWVLNGSYIDHSMLRNYMLYNISNEIMYYAPGTRLCEVLITDEQGIAQYQGVYTLIEKPKVSESRLNLPAYDPRYPETSFMLQMNAYIDHSNRIYIDENPIRHLLPDNITAHKMGIEYPGEQFLTPETMEYIQQQVLQFDRVLYDAVHTGDWESVRQYLNVDSFVDYYLINEFFQNYDAGNISTYFYQSNGGKMNIGPVWDFDGAIDNFAVNVEIDELRGQYSFYYYYLAQSPEFAELCIQRYHELRRTYLSEEYLLNYITSAGAYLGSAAQRNCELWYDEGTEAFSRDLEHIRRFIKARGDWMDENFERLMRVPQ